MDFIGLASAITRYAPFLANAVKATSPLAGLLVSAVGSAFGVDIKEADLTSLIARINTDPSAEVKLKKIQYDYEEIIFSDEVSDRDSARKREEEFLKITGKRDWLMEFIAIILIAGYFIMCSLLIFNKLDDKGNMQIIYMMFGQLTGGFIMVLSYYFGTSKQQQQNQYP
jgi:hypothetical protein